MDAVIEGASSRLVLVDGFALARVRDVLDLEADSASMVASHAVSVSIGPSTNTGASGTVSGAKAVAAAPRRRPSSHLRRQAGRKRQRVENKEASEKSVEKETKKDQFQDQSGQGKPVASKRSRIARRRPKSLRESKSQPDQDFRWLPETHIWLAKRMEMRKIWGFCVSDRSKTKSESFLIDKARDESVMHEASYTRTIVVEILAHSENERKEITRNFLRSCLDHADVEAFLLLLTDNAPLSEPKAVHSVLFSREGSKRMSICPVRLLWTGAESFVIWCHPLAVVEALESLKQSAAPQKDLFKIFETNLALSLFELTGPKSMVFLVQALQKCGWSVKDSELIKAFAKTPQTVRKVIPPQENNNARNFSLQKGKSVSSQPLEVSKQNEPFRCPLTGQLIAKRNMVAHFKRDLLKVTQVRPFRRAPKRSRSGSEESESAFSNQSLTWLHHESSMQEGGRNDQNALNLLIIRKEGSKIFPGWDIILPSVFGKELWMALSYAGCHCIGISLKHELNTLDKIPNYPEDFPDSKGSEIVWRSVQEAKNQELDRKPKAKRGVNFFKLGVESPFRPDWNSLYPLSQSTEALVVPRGWHIVKQIHEIGTEGGSAMDLLSEHSKQILCVSLVCARKYGDISPCSMISLATQQEAKDLALEHSQSSKFQAKGKRKKSNKEKKKKKKQSLKQYPIQPASETASRPTIGFVTSGSSKFSWQSIGIGFITVQSYIELLQTARRERRQTYSRRLLVLVREPHKNYFFPAFLSILTSSSSISTLS
jgi:hypothetical protein